MCETWLLKHHNLGDQTRSSSVERATKLTQNEEAKSCFELKIQNSWNYLRKWIFSSVDSDSKVEKMLIWKCLMESAHQWDVHELRGHFLKGGGLGKVLVCSREGEGCGWGLWPKYMLCFRKGEGGGVVEIETKASTKFANEHRAWTLQARKGLTI